MQKKAPTLSNLERADAAPQKAAFSGESNQRQLSSPHPFERTSPPSRRVTRRHARQAAARPLPDSVSVDKLPDLIETHLRHFDCGNFSPRTTQKKREFLGWFACYMALKGHRVCGPDEMRAFLIYLKNSHLEPEGRWGNGRPCKALRPSTINTHFRVVAAFFAWLLKEKRIRKNPLTGIDEPRVPRDQIQPLSNEQCLALLRAAEKSNDKARNRAIFLLFFDTGLRASEVCNSRLSNIDVTSAPHSMAHNATPKISLSTCCKRPPGQSGSGTCEKYSPQTLLAPVLTRNSNAFAL